MPTKTGRKRTDLTDRVIDFPPTGLINIRNVLFELRACLNILHGNLL